MKKVLRRARSGWWCVAALAALAAGGCRSRADESYFDRSRPLWKDLIGEEYEVSLPEYEFDRYDFTAAAQALHEREQGRAREP